MKQVPIKLASSLGIKQNKYLMQEEKEVVIYGKYKFTFEKGFITDYCSYPVSFRKLVYKIFKYKLQHKGKSICSCKLHDACYVQQFPKKIPSDIIMLKKSFITNKLIAVMKYLGASFGGHYAYYHTSKLDKYNKSLCSVVEVNK